MNNTKEVGELYFCMQKDAAEIRKSLGEAFVTPNRIVVIFVDNGRLNLTVDDTEVDLTDDLMMVLHPMQEVRIKGVCSEVKVSIIAFTMAIQDVVMKQFSLSFFRHIHNILVWKLKNRTQKALRSFYDLFEFNYSRDFGSVSTEIANSLFTNFIQMFYQLVRPYVDNESLNDKNLNTRSLGGRFYVLLNDHYKREHSVQFYANEMCISSKYLTQVVKQLSGKTPKEQIDRRIGMEALFLLTKSTLNIQEVSNELGFPDQSYFGRFFKRLFGISPLTYRMNPDLGFIEKLSLEGGKV